MEQDDIEMRKGMTYVFAGVFAIFMALITLANTLG